MAEKRIKEEEIGSISSYCDLFLLQQLLPKGVTPTSDGSVLRGGVFEKVWNLENLPTTLPGSMHTSSAVVSCQYIWSWVRSLLHCLHLSAVCSVTHVHFDPKILHELTVPFSNNSLFSCSPGRVCAIWILLCYLFVSADFLLSWSWHD